MPPRAHPPKHNTVLATHTLPGYKDAVHGDPYVRNPTPNYNGRLGHWEETASVMLKKHAQEVLRECVLDPACVMGWGVRRAHGKRAQN